MSRIRLGIVAVVMWAPPLLAQGIAFQPVVGSLPSGPILNATPAVSLDRRYVRLGINAQFIDNAAFSTFVVPGAVSGGPSGPGALGGAGLGGFAGGGGGGGGAAVGGGQFLAGMNGIINPSMGYDASGFPPGAAFPGDPISDGMAAWGFPTMPGQAYVQRPGRPRTATNKIVKRRPAPRGKTKPLPGSSR